MKDAITEAYRKNDAIGNENTRNLTSADVEKMLKSGGAKAPGSGFAAICEDLDLDPMVLRRTTEEVIQHKLKGYVGMTAHLLNLEGAKEKEAFGEICRPLVIVSYLDAFAAGVRYARENP